MLYGVSRLVRGDADRPDRRGIIDGIGEPDDLGARVVVIRQFAVNSLNSDMPQAVCVENGARGLRCQSKKRELVTL